MSRFLSWQSRRLVLTCSTLVVLLQGRRGQSMRRRLYEEPLNPAAYALPRAAFRDMLQLMGVGWLGEQGPPLVDRLQVSE